MLTDSKKKELSIDALLMVAAQQTKSPYPAEAVYASLVAEMNMKGTSTFRQGNTLFIMHHAKGRVGIFRALNADTGRNYLENAYMFAQAAYKMGFDTLSCTFKDPTAMNLFKGVFRNPPQEGMGYRAEKTNNGFRVTVKLGPKRPDRE